MANQYCYIRLGETISTTYGYLSFELPAFNEAIVQGRLENMTFEVTSFRVNRRQTRLISGLLQQV